MAKDNQRVAITKRLLKEALLRLLKKKNIIDISISELCEEAEVNRTTFYRHYATPYSVLYEIETDYFNLFFFNFKIQKDTIDIKTYATELCRYLQNNSDIVRLFIQNTTYNDSTKLFQSISEGFLGSKTVLYKGQAADSDTLRLITTFFFHGMYSLTRQWIIEDIKKTPEEIAELICGSFNRDFSFQ